jgi:hypothetical protein
MNATAEAAPAQIVLDHYDLDSGGRLIVALRKPGREHVDGGAVIETLIDCPEQGQGRDYVIETKVRVGGELDALLVDYKEQAADLGQCPMSGLALKEKLARGTRQQEALS